MKILAALAVSLAAALGMSLTAACAPKEEADDGRLRVVATTGMVADLARVVGGEHVHVDALMGPGVDPHLYQATPSDLTKLRRARLILYNGKGLEGKMASVFGKLAKSRKVVAVTEEIEDTELLGDHEHWDPHVWFDVSLWSRGAIVVGAALAEIDAEHADEYRAAALKYSIRLRTLHESVATQIAAVPKERRVLITSHDAFRYFGRAYGLEVRGLQGISTASSAGVRDVEQMVDLIVSRKIKAVFVESSVSPKAIEAVRESVQARGHDVVIGGELFSDFSARVIPAFESLVAQHTWRSLLLVLHGGVNRLLLNHVMKLPLGGTLSIEQDTCCINIIDLDTEDDSVVRYLVRAINITGYNLSKAGIHLTDMERAAQRMAAELSPGSE